MTAVQIMCARIGKAAGKAWQKTSSGDFRGGYCSHLLYPFWSQTQSISLQISRAWSMRQQCCQ
jgi:hypothetical protein